MKSWIFLIMATFFALPDVALADEVTGKIVAIDEEKRSLTLDNQVDYKLPKEFDTSVIAKDMKIMIVFDVKGDEKMITDVELAE
jgi:Protein of unknown function (DUF1344)